MGVSPASMLAKSVALALEKHPVINSAYSDEDGIVVNEDINISMAVIAIDGGLVMPTLSRVNKRNIIALSNDWKQLARKSKSGGDALQCDNNSGTFTVCNLSLLGNKKSESLLSLGQGGVLIVGSTRSEKVQTKKLITKTRRIVTMTGTFDARIVSTRDATNFLKSLKQIIQDEMDIVGATK